MKFSGSELHTTIPEIGDSHHVSHTIESWDRSSNRDQAHTRFEGGTHENHTERNEMSYSIRKRERMSRSS